MRLVFHRKTSKDGQYYFSLQNGAKMLLRSELYQQQSACDNGIESVKKHSQDDQYYEHKTSQNGRFFFNLKASNGQVIATSAMFDSAQASKENAKLSQTEAKAAPIEDK